MLANAPRAVVIRVSWLFSAHGSNFLHLMLRLAQSQRRASARGACLALVPLIALLIGVNPVTAGSAPPDLVVPMTPAPIAIDGQSDPAWAAAETFFPL